MFTCQRQDGLGQFIVAFGTQGGGLLAIVAQGDGLTRLLAAHAVSSTQRCSTRVRGP
ncbi:hypothetical protein D3C76_1703970 [compost metagenome]